MLSNLGLGELIVLLVPGCLGILFPILVIVLLWKIWTAQKRDRGFTVSDWTIDEQRILFYSREGALVAELRPAGPTPVLLRGPWVDFAGHSFLVEDRDARELFDGLSDTFGPHRRGSVGGDEKVGL